MKLIAADHFYGRKKLMTARRIAQLLEELDPLEDIKAYDRMLEAQERAAPPWRSWQ